MIDEKKLKTLVKDYEYRELDDDFIYDAFDVIRAGLPEAQPHLNQVHIGHGGDDDTYGSYFHNSGDMIIWIDQLHKLQIPSSLIYQFCLEAIRHEAEHAVSFGKYLSDRTDIETCVIRFTYDRSPIDDCIISIGNELTDTCYGCNPKERIAEIRAKQFARKLYRNKKGSLELSTANIYLICAYLRGYKSNGCYYEPPTYRFLERQLFNNMDLFHEYHAIKQTVGSTNYCFEKRILCGLPISNEEYNRLFNQLPEEFKRKVQSDSFDRFNHGVRTRENIN